MLPVSALIGEKTGVVISLLISLPVLYIYLYALSWGKNSPQIFNPLMLGLIATCLVVSATNIYIANMIQWYLSSKDIPHVKPTVVYMVLYFTLPGLYFLMRFLQDGIPTLRSISMDFEIAYDYRLPVFVDTVRFVNSKTGESAHYAYLHGFGNTDAFIPLCEFESMTLKNQYVNRLDFLHDGSSSDLSQQSGFDKHQIPLGTDKMRVSWYSFVEDEYYSDTFPFSISMLEIRKEFNLSHHRHVHQGRDLTFLLFPDGQAALVKGLSSNNYTDGGSDMVNFGKILEASIDTGKKHDFLQDYLTRRDYRGDKKALLGEFEYLKETDIVHRLSDQLVFYDWSVSLRKIGETSGDSITPNVEAVTGHSQCIRTAMDSNIRCSLPMLMKFHYDGHWYYIYLNIDALLRVVKQHVTPSRTSVGEPDIVFNISWDVADYQAASIQLSLGGIMLPFQSFEIYQH